MSIQTIYSRFEFPKGKKSSNEIFEEFSYLKDYSTYDPYYKVQLTGASICIRESTPGVVIMLTFDKETDDYYRRLFFDNDTETNIVLRLKFPNIGNIKHTVINQSVELTGEIK